MKLTDFLTDVGRPVAYYPSLAKALGGVKQTILVCQLIYWNGKQANPDGWIHKESKDIEEETGLSYKEQRAARKHLLEIGIIEEDYQRINHRMMYRIDTEKLNQIWEEFNSKPITAIPQMPEGQFGNLPEVSSAPAQKSVRELTDGQVVKGTEITTEITTENTTESLGADAPAAVSHSPSQSKSEEVETVKANKPDLQNPVVVLYRDTFNLTPNPEQRNVMIERVKDSECWQQTIGIWKLNRSNPMSIGDLLDRYDQIVERKNKRAFAPVYSQPDDNLWFPDNDLVLSGKR